MKVVVSGRMTVVERIVGCEYMGMLHDDEPDPLRYGPSYHGPEGEDDPKNWEFRSDPQYTGELWFFTCPGPHYKVYTRAEV